MFFSDGVPRDNDTIHDMILHDLVFDRCPECRKIAVRDIGERDLVATTRYHSLLMITTISVCPEHSLIITENDDWGGKTIERISDEVKWS